MRKFALLLSALLLMSGCTMNVSSGVISVIRPLSTPTPLAGDVRRGEAIFRQGTGGSPPCSTCHMVEAGGVGFSLGPNLAGIAERGDLRVEGLSAPEYIRQSVLDPHAFVAPGFRDIMYPNYSAHFVEQDIIDLIAYLMTLSAPI